MILKLVQIGNSQGIRLPKTIIDQFNFNDSIEAVIKREGLLLRKKTKPRAGWKAQILKEIKKGGCLEMLIPDNVQNEFDESEWQW
ncbi:MAG TPA: AbrB/MazE/SpoVT family DNA-binding domain-containing protein [Candidatus Kapabacteria bacterium]|nr:AbrB/MazE/SpoVT family DNA-binding domain-containing protein [Candidatus Kapabacteria bacterium]